MPDAITSLSNITLCRMIGEVYSKQLTARALHDVYILFPDDMFIELFRGREVWEYRKTAAHFLAEKLLERGIPEKLLKSIEKKAGPI